MSTTAVEVQAPVAGDAPPAEKKAVKEKKATAPKEKKPKQAKAKAKTKTKTTSHPPYFQMIKEALVALNEKSGSSPYAIAKFMEEKHEAVLPANFKKIMALQLKNWVSKGKLIKIKASYKLSEAGKMDKPASAKTSKKPAARAKRETRAASGKKKKKTEQKAKVVKKKAAAASKPKQPKSIRSPAAKKAKKVSA